jgi:hypothetical protein
VGEPNHTGGNKGRAPPGKARDVMDAGGVDGFGQARDRQDSCEPARQYQGARPGRSQQEHMWHKAPAPA